MVSMLWRDLSSTALVCTAGLSWLAYCVIYNLYFHPLARFPGPALATVTRYWKAWVECVQKKSFCHELERLHVQYGPIARVAPNELHFADPRAYHDIYNTKNRWDKERRLYHSFGEDRSSFGFLTYHEAKARKDVLGRAFSPTAVAQCEGLLTERIVALCTRLAASDEQNTPVDVRMAFRAFALDTITYLAFGTSAGALSAPGFCDPILQALDASAPVFVRFKHSSLYKNMIMRTPPGLAVHLSPETAGLVRLQVLLQEQIRRLVADPVRELADLPHNMTVYHRLMEAASPPGAGSLYEEAQALLFAGSDTVGATLMVGTFHLLREPAVLARLRDELLAAWPALDEPPKLAQLEQLPYLQAVIKEALRMSHGVVSGLLRVVPVGGATIAGVFVPGGTVVSIGSTFVDNNEAIFHEARRFRPERWLEDPELNNWLVAFSRGPRMCLGINLAWAELRLAFAHIFRKFDLTLTASSPDELTFRDAFLPHFYGEKVQVHVKPIQS